MKASFVSTNRHKARELGVLLPGWEIELDRGRGAPRGGRRDLLRERARQGGVRPDVDPRDRWTIGEDSGLEVDGLGGRPGIYSARYAGPGATDEENVAKLLEELAGVDGRRSARALRVGAGGSLAGAGGSARHGDSHGQHRDAAERLEGFGYDPVFIPDGEQRTVAELGDDWKARHSHRAAAARNLVRAVGTDAPAL